MRRWPALGSPRNAWSQGSGGCLRYRGNPAGDGPRRLGNIVDEVAQAGYVPSVHGDQHAHPAPMGCGFFKLWSLGELPGLEAPSYDSEQGQSQVLGAGGVYETLEGDHSESKVMINLVAGTTLEPKTDQRFVVDAWVTGVFDLDVPTYLTLAAETVERLNGPKVAQLIVG